MLRLAFLISTLLACSGLVAASPAHAHPAAGRTSVVVVMKAPSCGVCATQLRALAAAELGAPVVGITHGSQGAAAQVTRRTGVRTYSHPAGIQAMGLWLPELGIAQPAVVVFDRCGREAGRIVGRQPGVDVSERARALVKQADAVTRCEAKPVS